MKCKEERILFIENHLDVCHLEIDLFIKQKKQIVYDLLSNE